MSQSVKERESSRRQSMKPFSPTMKVEASPQSHEGEMIFRTPLRKAKPTQMSYPNIAASKEIPGLKELA